MPAHADPLTMTASDQSGRSVIMLNVGSDAQIGGQYFLEVTDEQGNRSESSGRFAPGQIGPAVTVTVSATASTHLSVRMDDGTTYERDVPASTGSTR